jgi:acyl carrier protein
MIKDSNINSKIIQWANVEISLDAQSSEAHFEKISWDSVAFSEIGGDFSEVWDDFFNVYDSD